jgi:hypothetical protein
VFCHVTMACMSEEDWDLDTVPDICIHHQQKERVSSPCTLVTSSWLLASLYGCLGQHSVPDNDVRIF